MPARIEDYALIGDCRTAALVSREGCIDWLCLPRFDSPAIFAALLGDRENGWWELSPREELKRTTRRYRQGTLILETTYETPSGSVRLIDFMPPQSSPPHLVRIVEGISGTVPMRSELALRFDYGKVVPWVRRRDACLVATAGPDAVRVGGDLCHHGRNFHSMVDFAVRAGRRQRLVLTWFPSHEPCPETPDADRLLEDTEATWSTWSAKCIYKGDWKEAVQRSLITLKALTHAPTGGIVAAPTTSLPEEIGGSRNWDYRYCWLRDATFTLYALLGAGYVDEACAWRDWLVRAVAGVPRQIQALYGIAGERRLPELELDWLEGYEGSVPVRAGNAACRQLQLDVFGEVMDALYTARTHGIEPDENAWRVQRALLQHLEGIWQQPDEGIWEVRSGRAQYTHSKIMAWVAFDRGVKSVERMGLSGPADRWRAQRDRIHAEVCEKGFDAGRNTFVQSYGSEEIDAALLMIPLVGFLPPTDPRVAGTVEAVQRELLDGGFVRRYRTESGLDGLGGYEGTFFLCSFWLVDCLALLGRRAEARRLFERLLDLRNDVGLLAEEYDPRAGRFLGNYPQAFSHVAMVNSARNLSEAIREEESPHIQRSQK